MGKVKECSKCKGAKVVTVNNKEINCRYCNK